MWQQLDATEVAFSKARGEFDSPILLFKRDGSKDSLDLTELLMYLNALENLVGAFLEGKWEAESAMYDMLNEEPMGTIKFLDALKESEQNGN